MALEEAYSLQMVTAKAIAFPTYYYILVSINLRSGMGRSQETFESCIWTQNTTKFHAYFQSGGEQSFEAVQGNGRMFGCGRIATRFDIENRHK